MKPTRAQQRQRQLAWALRITSGFEWNLYSLLGNNATALTQEEYKLLRQLKNEVAIVHLKLGMGMQLLRRERDVNRTLRCRRSRMQRLPEKVDSSLAP